MERITFSVFTKPWKTISVAQLGELVRRMGYTGIELPVRPGYQVEPQTIGKLLPAVAKELAQFDVRICSVAGPTDEATIAACAEAGVPVIRTMAAIPAGATYLEAEAAIQQQYDALLPALERSGVTIGVQNHLGNYVANALGLLRLIEKYNPTQVAAVWDAAHEAVAGGLPQHALDILWPRLCMVNLKNAFFRRTNGPEAESATWQHYWTSGRHGLASWPVVIGELKKRKYQGVVCLTAEYSSSDVDRLATEDLAFAKELFAK